MAGTMMDRVNPHRLFWLPASRSFTTAVCFSIRGDILMPWRRPAHHQRRPAFCSGRPFGETPWPSSWRRAVDFLGMRRLLYVAFWATSTRFWRSACASTDDP